MDPEAVTAFNLNLRRCQIFGWWKTDDSTSPAKKFAYALYRSLSVTWLLIFTILQLADLFEASSDLEELSTNLCGTSVSLVSTVKVIDVIRKSRRVENLVSGLRNNLSVVHVGREESDKRIISRGSSEIRKITKIFFRLVIPTVLLWCVMPFIDGATNVRLPLRLWMPYDWHSSPAYEISYCYQVAGLWLFAVAIVSQDLIVFGFIIQICCHYDILEKNIKRLGGSAGGEANDRKVKVESFWVSEIKKCVVHHQVILETINELQMIYQESFFTHFAGGVPLLCVIGFDIITAGRKTGISTLMLCRIGYVWSSIFDIFFYCYFGERLRQKGLGIAKAVYQSHWYRMGETPRKMLLTILARAQSSPGLSAVGLHLINLPAFLSILRITYNILALMVQMSR